METRTFHFYCGLKLKEPVGPCLNAHSQRKLTLRRVQQIDSREVQKKQKTTTCPTAPRYTHCRKQGTI